MMNRISLRQMDYFVSTAKYGSIILASEKIHVSSSSISAAIAYIESELKVQLFIRQHARGLVLTGLGDKMNKQFLFILGQADALYHLTAEFSNTAIKTLNVGCNQLFSADLFSHVFDRFCQRHPHIKLNLFDANHDVLMTQLLSKKVDVLISTDHRLDHALVNFEHLLAFDPYVLLGQGHPLAHKSILSLQQLCAFPMVLLDRAGDRDYVTDLFQRQGLTPNIEYSYQNLDLVLSMLSKHWGYSIFNNMHSDGSFLAEHTMQNNDSKNNNSKNNDFQNSSYNNKALKKIPLSGDLTPLNLGIVTTKNANLNAHSHAFIEFCRASIFDYYLTNIAMQRHFNLNPTGNILQ